VRGQGLRRIGVLYANRSREPLLQTDPMRMCELLVGLPDVTIDAVADEPGEPLVVHVSQRVDRPVCASCAVPAVVKDRPVVELVDLCVFGRPARLAWRKHRWECRNPLCPMGSWTGEDSRIAPVRLSLTDRAGRWVTEQVGRHGRSVAGVAADLACCWHVVNDAVIAYGTALIDDPDRIGPVTAVGLDETLFSRVGPHRRQAWSTQIVDVRAGVLLDVVEGRDSVEPCRWFTQRPDGWRAEIEWATLDLANSYRAVFDTVLPHALQVADPFHVVRVANQALDETRRRVQNETLGHRGRKNDPLYRSRRLLTMAAERISDNGRERLRGLLDAGDPHGEVRMSWHAKEVVRGIYAQPDEETATGWVNEIVRDFTDRSMPVEVRRLGRTIGKWNKQILNWHKAFVTNGPTEAVNNLVKRVKRVAFGFKHFATYRIRVLLYAGAPNWDLLPTITPR
jgi:transposase